MNFSPKALFFDWDHTLWDHDLNAREVLLDLANEYELAIEPLSYWASFEKINNGLWDQYAAGEISQAELRGDALRSLFSRTAHRRSFFGVWR
jgi:putative hydrolase of the HAD superfamily